MDRSEADSLAGAITKAIENERYGRHFYLMAASSTTDEKGRNTFGQLAEEERDHEAFLTAQLKSLREKGAVDASATLAKKADLSGDSPIFSDSVKTRAREAHAEMSALGIGVQIELASEQFYRRLSEEASETEVKKLFTFLADWEAGHYHALLKQQEQLKEDYWSEGGFAPF